MYKFVLRMRRGFSGVSPISPGEEKVMVSTMIPQIAKIHLVSIRPESFVHWAHAKKNCNICCKVLSGLRGKRILP